MLCQVEHMNDIKKIRNRFKSFPQGQVTQFAVGGNILQRTVNGERRGQRSVPQDNQECYTVFGTSTAPKGTVSSIHQSSRDPARRVIIHQIERYKA